MTLTDSIPLTLPINELRPNAYNPNQMPADAFQELVTEITRLGRVMKPIVVRRAEEGYIVVDGEHNLHAARQAGLSLVSCELIDVDDFEAMRQTFKRNQHGRHNPVLDGRMFRQMLSRRDATQQGLAAEIGVSEGTIRNALLYAEAADLRNDFAFETLTIIQVRCFHALPPAIGNLWLDSGAEIDTLIRAHTSKSLDHKANGVVLKQAIQEWKDLEKTGLTAFFMKKVSSTNGFVEAIETLRAWDDLERNLARSGITRDDLRPYLKHHYTGAYPVRTAYLMEAALTCFIDAGKTPVRFLLTPEEFESVLNEPNVSLAYAFHQRLREAVTNKGEMPPVPGSYLRQDLDAREIEADAPEYIQRSELPIPMKVALWKTQPLEANQFMTAGEKAAITQWKANGFEKAKQALAAGKTLLRKGNESWPMAVDRLLESARADWQYRAEKEAREVAIQSATVTDLAKVLATAFPHPDSELTRKFEAFSKEELAVLIAWRPTSIGLAGLVSAYKNA